MKTRITEMLGIEYPILCGGMMRLAYPRLCAAVSNAGGLGNLTAGNFADKAEFVEAIRQTRQMTDKPFWVNVTLLPAIGIGEERYRDYFDIIAAERIAAVEISGTPLDKFDGGVQLRRLKDAGVRIFHKVGSVRHAKHAEKAGYDAVIAAGVEEGGHPLNDNVATTVLTPRIAESVGIPVVTTGGVADGRGLAAALCLGADGVMMASRFICTDECEVHSAVQKELIERQEFDTVLYGNSIGLQGRALLNDSIKKVLEIEARGGEFAEIIPHIVGTLGPDIWQEGKVNTGSINVGQSIGLIHEVVPVKELLDTMVVQAKQIMARTRTCLES